MTDPAARRRGVARALMLAAEQLAVERGRTLLKPRHRGRSRRRAAVRRARLDPRRRDPGLRVQAATAG